MVKKTGTPKKYTLEVRILKDRMIRERIGAISVHWSVLELMVERVIATLEGNPGIVTYEKKLARRLEDLKELAKTRPTDEAEELVTIAGDIKSLSHKRHRAIHGLWGLDTKGRLLSQYPTARNGQVEKTMTPDDLKQLKLQIWRKGIRPLGKFAPFHVPTELASRRKQT